jgi:hypothetical protein
MPPVGFEPTISASERQQTNDLDRAATAALGVNSHIRSQTLSLPAAEGVGTRYLRKAI